MSKAAANMAGMLLSQELRASGVCVTLLHPGFNKTAMTKKYEAIWEGTYLYLRFFYICKLLTCNCRLI